MSRAESLMEDLAYLRKAAYAANALSVETRRTMKPLTDVVPDQLRKAMINVGVESDQAKDESAGYRDSIRDAVAAVSELDAATKAAVDALSDMIKTAEEAARALQAGRG